MIKFGTDGWRGVIGDTFTFENVRRVALAHARVLADKGAKRVVVGYDRRFLSEAFATQVAGVFKEEGFEVFLSEKECTTPMVSFAVRYMGFDGGVMITASHNPPQYNGYKIKESSGGAATTEFIREVEEHLEKITNVKPPPTTGIERIDIEKTYINIVRQKVNMELLKEYPLLVVHDPMYGSSAGLLEKVLAGTEVSVVSIRHRHDPLFGGHAPEPVEKYLSPLMEKVRSIGAHLGVANDGDGDRLALVDEKGSFVNTQLVYVLLLLHLVKDKGMKDGVVVKTVSTTQLVDVVCAREGLKLIEVPVGFKHINEIMQREKVLMGGEESGGFGLTHFLPERDGIFSALNIVEMLLERGKSLSDLVQDVWREYGRTYYSRIDLHVDEKTKEKLKNLLQNPPEKVGRFSVSHVSTLDGLKLFFQGGGWLLMRASGTEPLIRVYGEMNTQEDLQQLLASATDMLGL
ncbi:phosphoglucomutase/phosphomannomutase alpha/beta/alpha domain I [Thermocrinis albus DSM 14484]|uniref:Phosphoglucomutase/phosphomannomutase alpha/beta/alpha domain I n=1 Tax=Thermocrinis albus (strain DSM 14484 / JCM 11386 / HI 11/12) TaxID=638303 RepID=D3SPC9_THEAH|nr:phosphoglucomutase/phosphomannomutase family protein [Thermocrinis albus]ADC89016.1 phosphoglucomutase/phosphomannomutase alpha/beta/alpha domain I [Thermocrinis albus DSM 14484]